MPITTGSTPKMMQGGRKMKKGKGKKKMSGKKGSRKC
jgi:hypothetical protein